MPGATGFRAGEHAGMLAQAAAQRDQIKQAGEDVLRCLTQLTGGGLQGDAADATQMFAQEINRASQNADEAVRALEVQTQQFGDNMQSTDATFASRIGG